MVIIRQKYYLSTILFFLFNYILISQNLNLYPSSIYFYNDNNNHLQFNNKGFGTNYSTILFDNIQINSVFDNSINLHHILSENNYYFESNISSDFNITISNHIGSSISINSKTLVADSTMVSVNGGNTYGSVLLFKSYNYDYYYINALLHFETVNGIFISDSKSIPYNLNNSKIANSAREDISFMIKTGLKNRDSELSLTNYFVSNYNEFPLSIYEQKPNISADNKWNLNISNISYNTEIYGNKFNGNIYYKYSNINRIISNYPNISNYTKKIEENTFGINNTYNINTNNNYFVNFILNYQRNSLILSETQNFSFYKINSENAKFIITQEFKIDSTINLGINTGYFVNSFNSTIYNKYNINYNDFNYTIYVKYLFLEQNYLKLELSYNSQSPAIIDVYADIIENNKLLGLNNIITSNNLNFEFNYNLNHRINILTNFYYSSASNLPEKRNEYLSFTSDYDVFGLQLNLNMNLNIINCLISYSQISSSIYGNYRKIDDNLIFPSNRMIVDFYNKFDFGLSYHIKADYTGERIDYNFEFGTEKILKEYYAIGLFIAQDFKNKSNVYISIENIFNSYLESYYGYPQNGINFKAGVNLYY